MKALVLFSGGVDSSTCLGMAVSRYGAENVVALSVQYGQKHEKEVEAAEKIARYYNVELVRLDLTPIFAFSDCPLLKQSEQEIPDVYKRQIQTYERQFSDVPSSNWAASSVETCYEYGLNVSYKHLF